MHSAWERERATTMGTTYSKTESKPLGLLRKGTLTSDVYVFSSDVINLVKKWKLHNNPQKG